MNQHANCRSSAIVDATRVGVEGTSKYRVTPPSLPFHLPSAEA